MTLQLDPRAVPELFEKLRAELEEQLSKHQRVLPNVPAQAAGKVLMQHSRRLAELYVELHARQVRRMIDLVESAEAAVRDTNALIGTEGANTRAVGGVMQ